MYEYFCMTQAEFYYKSEGFKRNIKREWERTRALSYTIHIHNVDKKNRLPYERYWNMDEEKQGGLNDDFVKRYWQKKQLLIDQENGK